MGKYRIKYETNGIINETKIEFSTESAIRDILINHHKVDNPIIIQIQKDELSIKSNTVELKNENTHKSTDIYAVITFATALIGFMFLPLLFVPICFIFSLISYYRIKDNKSLQGNSLRLAGAITNAVNILYLMYTFQVGIFKHNN